MYGTINTMELMQVRTAKRRHDIICFHIQQRVEKYLKVWLQEANIPIPRTHELKELLALIVQPVAIWHTWEPDFSELSKHAVAIRYPRDSATAANAGHAMHICNEVCQAVREQLKLPIDGQTIDTK